MNRTEFLKNTCKYGLCGCLGFSFLQGNNLMANPAIAEKDNEPDWRIDFMQSRFTDLIYILNNTLDQQTLNPILNQLGAKCGDTLANKYKDNPEGFFNFIKSNWAESVEYDKEKGAITVNENKRETCNCPMIKEKNAPKSLCNCSLGTQKRIYESLFGRPVNVTLNQSVLSGGERCSFTIQLL